MAGEKACRDSSEEETFRMARQNRTVLFVMITG